LRAGLCALLGFVAGQPLARALVVEVHDAGGQARVKYEEVRERLTCAADARRETGSSPLLA
jgi:hypothetical protein